MNEFIIVFRESLEACLIVGIIYSFLSRSNLTDAIKKLWLGVGASLFASILVAFLVVYLKGIAGDTRYEKLFEALFMYAAAGLIWYVVFWLSKHVSDKKDLESKTEKALKMSTWGVFWVVFFSILREGFETVVMLLGQDRGDGFSFSGFALGAILALVHDVIITLGVFSLTGFEITLSTVAAFLTIVGYSLNDTVVVFDLSLIHISEPTRLRRISFGGFGL